MREDVDAAAPDETRGAADGLVSDELNVTPLSWKAGSGPPEHVNEERDVLVVVLDGSATLSIDGEEHARPWRDGDCRQGQRRGMTAGRDGVRYLHRSRPPLQIGRLAAGS